MCKEAATVDFFSQLVEERIAEARRKGEFDNLQGAGKPLELEDLSHIPEELRVGYKLLKNSGYVPEEVQLAKELIALQDLIAMCEQDDERRKLSKQLMQKVASFAAAVAAPADENDRLFARFAFLVAFGQLGQRNMSGFRNMAFFPFFLLAHVDQVDFLPLLQLALQFVSRPFRDHV